VNGEREERCTNRGERGDIRGGGRRTRGERMERVLGRRENLVFPEKRLIPRGQWTHAVHRGGKLARENERRHGKTLG